MSFCEWEEEDWSLLIQAIRQKKCILLLGTDAAVVEVDGKSKLLSEILAQQLAGELDKETREKINTSNLAEVSQYYCLPPKPGRINLELKVQDFYKQGGVQSSQFHKNLAAMPFYFTISTSPDKMFYEALKQQNKEPITTWYNFKRKRAIGAELGSVGTPLIFHLYGTIDYPESLVLTENDLLDFLVEMKPDSIFPDQFINELKKPDKIFLFIGFGFKHWHLRIILHALRISRKENRSLAVEDFEPQSEEEFKSTVFFYQKNACNIHIFKWESSLDEFAKQLRIRYEKSLEIPDFVHRDIAQKAPKVFICHASEDKDFAASMYEKLKQSGLYPWLDKEDLRGGDLWDETIKKAIKKEIDYFLVLQSQSLSKKLVGYVNKEIVEARERQKEIRVGNLFIIPVKIEDCPLLDVLEDLQTVDLTDGNGIDRLVQTIKRDYAKRGN